MDIPTLNTVLSNQNNLDVLCADRELTTCELFEGNAFYGNDFIVKKYAGLPLDYPLKVIIPHGIVLNNNYLWQVELRSQIPIVMNYQLNRKHTYKKALGGMKQVVDAVAPFAYVPELLGVKDDPNKNGTIFFPAHSTHHVTVQMDYAKLADQLCSLSKEYQPVTVCVYWKDFNLGLYKIFEKKGLNVVSAGHIYDPLFLFRFYHLCSLHKYSGCNSIGSHVFFSGLAGCKCFYLNSGDIERKGNNSSLRTDVALPCDEWHTELLDNLRFPPEHTNSEMFSELISSYLGLSHRKSKYKLKFILANCEVYYQMKKSASAFVKVIREKSI